MALMRPRLGSRPAALFSSLLGMLLAVAVVPMTAGPAQAADITIQGTITGLNGVKVEGVFVEANDANGAPLEPRRYAYTQADGTYSFTVPVAGTYKIDIECWGAYACAQDYAPEPTITQAISSTVTINATLERWGRITGTVKKNGVATAWPNGLVEASNDARQYWSSYPGVPVAPNGTFTIEKVAPGTVRVDGDESWDAEPFLTAGQDVTVPAGGTATIDLAVTDWRGSYARAVQPDGTPLPNIRFNIFSRPLGGGAWDDGIQAGPLLTNASGRMKWRVTDTTREYAICLYDDYLEPGTTPPAERHLSRCLGNAATRDTATLWTPSAATPNVKQDIVLPYAFAAAPVPTISGTAAVGATLTAVPGTWTPTDATLTYAWFRSGTTAPIGTGPTYQLVEADLGRTITVRATAVRTNYVTTSKTSAATTAVSAGAFTSTPAPTIAGTQKVGSTLTASTLPWTPAATTSTYEWFRSGVVAPVGTGATYTLLPADLGKTLTVKVTGVRTGYATTSRTSAATAVIGLGAFTSAPVPTITGTTTVDRTLTATAGTWTPAATTTTYQWLRGDTPIAGATQATYQLAAADAGQTIKVAVTGARDGYVQTTKTSVATAPVAQAAFTTVPTPTVTGTAAIGATLTADAGTWVPTPDTTTYEWFRGGVAIPDATGPTYQLVAADAGQAITVKVTGARAGYVTAADTSVPTAAVLAGFTTAPTPTITGTRAAGSTLTANAGTWAPAPTTTSYQWLRNGVAIANATSRTYRLTTADGGQRIAVRVTAARDGYATTAKTSTATGAILRLFSKAPAPRVTGTLRVRSLLTAVLGTWSPTPSTTRYQWYRNGVAIRGATNRTYRLVAADKGRRIKVIVKRGRTGYVTTTRSSVATTAIR
jgi:hypothetical protein